MATFTTYAEPLEPDHAQMKLYEVGTLTRLPGDLLGDILRRTGGAYELPPDPRTTVLVDGATVVPDVPMGAIAPSGMPPARTLDE